MRSMVEGACRCSDRSDLILNQKPSFRPPRNEAARAVGTVLVADMPIAGSINGAPLKSLIWP